MNQQNDKITIEIPISSFREALRSLILAAKSVDHSNPILNDMFCDLCNENEKIIENLLLKIKGLEIQIKDDVITFSTVKYTEEQSLMEKIKEMGGFPHMELSERL